jgi:hypothetical protein
VIREGGPAAVDLLVALADAARDTQDLAALGAGPVENLFFAHGESVWPSFDAAAADNTNLRLAMDRADITPLDVQQMMESRQDPL